MAPETFAIVETAVDSGSKLDPFGLYDMGPSGGKCSLEEGPQIHDRYPGPVVVRRPTLGAAAKGERHAYLQVMDANRNIVPIYNSDTSIYPPAYKQDYAGSGENKTLGKSHYYTDFLVQRVAEQRSEKIQIVETFGSDFFYAFGERPVILAVSGTLYNALDFAWRDRFWENYERYLRGTRLVELGGVAYFGWDDQLAEGYVIGATASEDTTTEGLVNFSFNFLVVDRITVSNGTFASLQGVLDGKIPASSFLELVNNNNDLEIYDGSTSLITTSKGMRTRQRLAKMGILGTMLARGSFDIMAEMMIDPQATLESMGKQWIGAMGDLGAELTYEAMNAIFKFGPTDKGACIPYSLPGKDIAKEWWIDTVGWVWRLLQALDRGGVDIPEYVYDGMTTPDAFISIFVPRALNATGEGSKIMAIIGVIGLGALAGNAIGNMFFDVTTSNISVLSNNGLSSI